MPGLPFDVAILGSGFGGSLLSIILRRLGRSVVMIDRQRHPRFAIGESSTPVADFVLELLCDRYELPRVRPLARYGTWRRAYPDVACGLKRGFSYFHHRPGEPFTSDERHSTELLVSASATDDASDPQWYRADVDQFLAREAVSEGVVFEEGVDVGVEAHNHGWRVVAKRERQEVGTFDSRFLIDGTGAGSATAKLLGLSDFTTHLQTNSRTVFSHVVGLQKWHDLMQGWGLPTEHHPYRCDDSTIHHIIDGGWMWVIPFDNGITSVGFAIDANRHPADGRVTPADEFQQWLKVYPSITEQFAGTAISSTFPSKSPLRSGRIQRFWSQAAGPGWCLLPSTGGFIDPFYSTGIGHTLNGILRLGEAFESWSDPGQFQRRLEQYSTAVAAETRLIDQIVATAYPTMGRDPELLHAATSLYFVAATTFEHRFPTRDKASAFLLADDPAFVQIVRQIREDVLKAARVESVGASRLDQIRRKIEPYNHVGFLAPESGRMYRSTSAK